MKNLDRQLKLRDGLKPIYILLGDSGLAVSRAEAMVVEAALAGGGASFNKDSFRAGEEGAEGALSVARTLPMMAPRRVVILREPEAASPALLQALADYFASPNPSTVFIVSGSKWPAPSGGKDWGRRAEGVAKKGGGLALRLKAKDQDPIAFAVGAAAALGCTLGRREARLLVERVGSDLGRLELEIAKAAAWLGGSGALTAEVLEEVCSLLAGAEIWTLTDALVTGRADRALETTHRLLEGGEPPHKLLNTVTWRLRQLLIIQDFMRRGRSPASAGLRMSASKLRAAEQALRERPLDGARVLETLTAANRAMNSHRAGHRRIVEGLILALLAT